MTDVPSEPAVDDRLRDFLAAELRKAEQDFPLLPRRQRVSSRGRLPIGLLAAAVVVLAFAVIAPRVLDGPSLGTGGTPLGSDGLPLSIDGEQVARGDEIAARLGDGSFLAGGTLVLDTSPCLSRSARAQLGCGEGWELVGGPAGDTSAVFVLDGVADAPGFVRTSGAPTVARVHAYTPASGAANAEILVVEAIAWRQPTKGPVPAEATPPEGGETNGALWPDFVSTWARDGVTIAGYVPKRYLLDGGPVTPGDPSNPPQALPVPVYGEDLTTLIGHMVPGVGFVALGATPEVSSGPTASVSPSVAPSGAPAALESSSITEIAPGVFADCGGTGLAACEQAIALARAGNEADLVGTTLIVVDDICAPQVMCDRFFPFDSIVVFVTAGGDTTRWWVFRVVGHDPRMPTQAERWLEEVPRHIEARIRAALATP